MRTNNLIADFYLLKAPFYPYYTAHTYGCLWIAIMASQQ